MFFDFWSIILSINSEYSCTQNVYNQIWEFLQNELVSVFHFNHGVNPHSWSTCFLDVYCANRFFYDQAMCHISKGLMLVVQISIFVCVFVSCCCTSAWWKELDKALNKDQWQSQGRITTFMKLLNSIIMNHTHTQADRLRATLISSLMVSFLLIWH